MAPFAGECIQIERQRCHQRFSFTGLHFGDFTLVEHNAANELHIVVALTNGTPGCFAYHGEGFGKKIIERFAIGETLLELIGFGAQFGVRKRLNRWFETIDPTHNRLDLLDRTVRTEAEQFLEECFHGISSACCGWNALSATIVVLWLLFRNSADSSSVQRRNTPFAL